MYQDQQHAFIDRTMIHVIRGEIKVLLCFPKLFFGQKFLVVMSHYFFEMSPLFQRWWDIVSNLEISWQNTATVNLVWKGGHIPPTAEEGIKSAIQGLQGMQFIHASMSDRSSQTHNPSILSQALYH